MRLEEKLATLFHHQKISSVLDLGAGDGRRSIFCASYGAKVVAIDNQSKPDWQFPTYLTLHPAIHFFQADLKELPRPCDQRYDLILLFNVIIFLKKNFVLSQLLPYALSQLSPWGRICLTFFFADDQTMGVNQKLSFYTFEDFQLIEGYALMHCEEKYLQDSHPPYGEHQHHLGYLEIIKKEGKSDALLESLPRNMIF